MADTALQVVVAPFLGVIYEQLSFLISTEFALQWDVNEDLEKLSEILSTIRDVLEDAEAMQIRDKTTTRWLRKLKDAAYDADDVLDECAYESLLMESNVGASEQVSASISAFFDLNDQSIRRREMGKNIKKIIERFDAIVAQKTFHLSPGERRVGVDEGRETSSMLTEPVVYGRDDDRESIVGILLKNLSDQNSLSICPILGIGGIGKTTLAQLVYKDERVVEQFDRRIWVCVSDDFGVRQLTKAIIESNVFMNLDHMQNQLRELLKGKKFLLVLDDVWSEDVEIWNKVKCLLACGEKGSSIIVTTRLKSVVDSLSHQLLITESNTCIINQTIPLNPLSENFCLSLFKQHAFGIGNEENPGLVEIGKEIVSKCGGVPLAVKALGGLLRYERRAMWKVVRDSELWELGKHGENSILPSLKLSYNHLPSHLKQCFAYCFIFPKDSMINREELIHLWIANDFVQTCRGMELEESGDKIFNELLRRSFFQDIEEDEYGNIEVCKMHDLMHDLASLVMVNERHVSLVQKSSSLQTTSRTFFSFSKSSSVSNPLPSNFQQFKRLRVLSLSYLNVNKTLLASICHLKHLRYLNLRRTGITSLPNSFGCLLNLQSLDLSYNDKLTTLPVSIGNLERLRHLNLCHTGITSLPNSFSCRLNLQSLDLSSNNTLTTLPDSIGNLERLRHLNLHHTLIATLPESISRLQNLCELDLQENKELTTLPLSIAKLENLRRLDLLGTSIEQLPESVCHLKSLQTLLVSWEKFTQLPVGIGRLTCLEKLYVFTVGPGGEGARIQELHGLNQITGEMEIRGLEHVRNSEDAHLANLRSKKCISKLILWWSCHDDKVDSQLNEMVLEVLQPHPNLKSLTLKGYPGVIFPSWMGDFSALPNLTHLYLKEWSSVQNKSSTLKCKEEEASKEVVFQLPRLVYMLIEECPILTPPAFPSSLQKLELKRSCNEVTLSLVENLPHLSSLVISHSWLEVFPTQLLRNLTSLQFLWIWDCQELKSLPVELENLTTLTNLSIRSCGALDSFPNGLQKLTSLLRLEIIQLQKLRSLTQSLPHSLQRLRLKHCPELEIEIQEFQHLISLELDSLPKLTSLPGGLQHVTTLKWICIRDCRNLKVLQEWVQNLSALEYFVINRCHPELHERCKKDKGRDWHKISHIPHFHNYA